MGGNLKNKLDNFETNLDTGKAWSKLDRHFKRMDINDLETDLEVDEEWEKIKDTLERRKKRRGIIWWLFGLSTALLLLITFILTKHNKHDEFVDNEAIAAYVVNQNDDEICLETNNINSTKKEVVNSNLTEEDILQENNNENLSHTILESAKMDVNTTSKSIEHLLNPLSTSPLENTEDIRLLKNDLQNESSLVNKSEVHIPPTWTNVNTDSFSQQLADVHAYRSVEISIPQPVETLIGYLELPFPTLDGLYPSILSNSVEKWSSSLSYSSQAGFVSKSGGIISAPLISDGSYSNLPLESFSNSLMIKKRSYKNFHTSFGLRFSRINEILKYSNTVIEEEILTNQSNVTIVNADGNISDRSGSLKQYSSYNINIEHYNNFDNLSLPIYVMYQLDRRHMNYSFGLGYEFPIYSRYEGRGIDDDGFAYSLRDNVIVKNTNTFHVEAGLSKAIKSYLMVGLKSSFDFRKSDLYYNNNIKSQSYKLFNLGLSLNYKIK